MDVGEARFQKSLRADLFQRVRQADTMDILAVHERAVANLGNTVRDLHRSDTEKILHASQTAAIEGVVLNFLQLADRHNAVDERLMIIERVGVNRGDRGRQIDNAHIESRKYNAVFIRVCVDAVDCIVIVLVRLLCVKHAALVLEIFVFGADVDCLQGGAVHQHPACDIPHIRRNCQLGHGFVVLKVTVVLIVWIRVSENVVVVQEYNRFAVDLVRYSYLFIIAGVVCEPDFIVALIGFRVIS